MGSDMEMRGGLSDDEFWKKYLGIRKMLALMKKRNELIRYMREEIVIPDHARDLAIKAVTTELIDNKKVFFDYLLNFISISMQGLHKCDIEFSFTIFEGGKSEINACSMIVDGEFQDLPVEIGTRFIGIILDKVSQRHLEAVLQFYRQEEAKYDKMLGGGLDRCTLQIMEELYPKRRSHIRLKLPAQSLIEHRISIQ